MVFFLFSSEVAQAQQHLTKEAKVILAVDAKSEKVTHMMLFVKVQAMHEKELRSKYPNAKFYIGLLKGSYASGSHGIIPGKNATIIMYTDKQFFPTERFSREDRLSPGDEINIGTIKTKVISNKKGELIVKT